MPSIHITVEIGPGKRAEFEREVEDLVDGTGREINAGVLRPMWLDISGEVSHWIRYREPTEAKAAE